MAGQGAIFGSFAEGLTKGLSIFNDQNHRSRMADLQERSLSLQEKRNADLAEQRRIEHQWAVEDRAAAVADRKANEPILSAKRALEMNELERKQRLNNNLQGISLGVTKDWEVRQNTGSSVIPNALGQRPVMFNGKQVGGPADVEKAVGGAADSYVDFYMKRAAPQLVGAYLEAGDVDTAQKVEAWGKNAGVQRGMREAGLALNQAIIGNWSGTAQALNGVFQNQDYAYLDGQQIEAEAVQASPENPAGGVRLIITNAETGERSHTPPLDRSRISEFVNNFLKPEAVVQNNLAAIKEMNDVKAKEAGKQADHARAVELADRQSANRIDEKLIDRAARGQDGVSQKDYGKWLREEYETLTDTGGDEFAALSEEEKWAVANDRVRHFVDTAEKGRQGASVRSEEPQREAAAPSAAAAPGGAALSPDAVVAQRLYGAPAAQPQRGSDSVLSPVAAAQSAPASLSRSAPGADRETQMAPVKKTPPVWRMGQ